MTPTRKRLLCTAAVLVAAASVAIVRGHYRISPDLSARRLAALTTALGAQRVVEPRLTGGFQHGTPPTVTRSVVRHLDDYSPDVRIAIAEIEKLEMSDRTAATRALVGLAYLAIGDAAKAVPA